MSGRWCKTCRHLRRIASQTRDGEPITVFRCGYTAPAPWAYGTDFTPNSVIGPRHVVPGDHYVKDGDGSTSDWSEVMDCPTWVAS